MCNYLHNHGHYGLLLLFLDLYTNIDLLISLLILHNYKMISLVTKFFLIQIVYLCKHVFMDIVAFYKNRFYLSILPANYHLLISLFIYY